MKFAMVFLMLAVMTMAGCATSHMATDIGEKIGDSYAETAKKGIPSADQIKSAWPYVSGLIKGLTAEDYDFHVTQSLRFVITRLDELCKREILTEEEKGLLVGYTVRLETLAGKEFWDKYGSGLFDKIKLVAGGLL